jgi:ABC-2 type transport system ATP-binding protein
VPLELSCQLITLVHGHILPFAFVYRDDERETLDVTEGGPCMATISVSGLRKTYRGGVEAVKGVDFEVAAGEVFGLLGPNGAGKSTTVGMLSTTVVPSAGTALVAGFDVASSPLEARRVSSVVFQEAVVDRPLTGRRNLELHARLWGVAPREIEPRIDEIAGVLGLGGLIDRPAGSYSGGERRRLEIARALVSHPRVLFLDEPTVGLDPRIRAELLDVIAGLRARDDMTTVLTTHYLDEAEKLCDRVGIMHSGRVVALDTPGALRATLGRELVEVRVDGRAESVLRSLRSDGIAGPDGFAIGSTLTLPVHDGTASQTLAAINASGLSTSSVATRAPTLDDVYLRLTGDRLAEAA